MKKYYSIGFLLFSAFFFSSCLKDKNIDDQLYGLKGLEDVKLAELVGAPSRVISLVASDVDTTFVIVGVHLNSAKPANKDITVTLVPDATVIDDYNNDNGTNYVVPPSGSYTLSDLNVVIPKGSRDGSFTLTAKSSDLAGGEYAFGYKIESISDAEFVISRNYSTLITIVGVKNKYDGHYSATGTMLDAASASLTGYYPLEWDLVTNGSSQVIVYDRDYTGTPAHIIYTGTGLSQYGSFGLIVNFDPATDKITSVVNFYGQPASNSRSAELDPSGINMWDPVTQSIDIKYWMNQPSVIPGHRTSFDEHWEYVGAR